MKVWRSFYLPISCLCMGRAHDDQRLLSRESEALERKGGSALARNNHIAGSMMHPACKYVPWKGRLMCAEGVDADAVAEVVRTRHVPLKMPSSHDSSDVKVLNEHRFDGVMQAIENANKRALNPNLRENHHEVAILMTGLAARDAGRQERCTMRGKQRQLIAARSQIQHVFGPLQSAGFRVKLFLTTSDCSDPAKLQSSKGDSGGGSSSSGRSDNFTATLKHAYSPWLADFQVASCDQATDKRCLLKHALELLDGYKMHGLGRRSSNVFGAGDVVLFTRPDLLFNAPGAELAVDLARLASNGTLAWPFACELQAWRQWQCAADTLVAAPVLALPQFRKHCMGKVSCWPEAQGAGDSLVGSSRTKHSATSGPFVVDNWARQRVRRLVTLPTAADTSETEGVIAPNGLDIESTHDSNKTLDIELLNRMESHTSRTLLGSSEVPRRLSQDSLEHATQPFDALSRGGAEDFRKPHGPVWKSGHGCYRCTVKMLEDGVQGLDAAFARKENWFVNTRIQKNPYYTFAGG